MTLNWRLTPAATDRLIEVRREVDRRFGAATRFRLVGAALSFFGFIHAGSLSPAGGIYHIAWASGWQWAVGYLLSALFFTITGLWVKRSGQSELPHEDSLSGHG